MFSAASSNGSRLTLTRGELRNVGLPRFTLDGYRDLLTGLTSNGYALHPTTAIPHEGGRCVFLRHDVDLHLEGALELAAVEECAGVRSTWYIGTRLAYNPSFEPNAAVIRELAKRGHSIGLHYVAGQELMPDMQTLEAIQGGQPITQTWVMHEPSAGGADRHMHQTTYATGNPHAWGLPYVSDSGMQWHEPWIGALLAGEPERAMLNTHHEHWLGDGDCVNRKHSIEWTTLRSTWPYVQHLLKGYV